MPTLTFLFAFIAVLALIGVAAWLVRRFAGNRLGASTNRGRMPRLAVIDAAAVDGRRRLVLVRRDNVEHLLMIGGPTDIVVEPNIVRATARDQAMPRPAVASAEPPPRVAPLPDTAWAEAESVRAESARVESARVDSARADSARVDSFDSPEPAMPEPPPLRPTRPSFADELRRPTVPPLPERREPLAGFTPEPAGSRPEPRPEPLPPRIPRAERTEPLIPRAPRPPEPKLAPAPPVRPPERPAAPPPPPPPPPSASTSSADANLAEMAQRLEAALRRPAATAGSDTGAPPVAPETPPAAPRPARSETPPAPQPQKSGFENLEDEMASLLGRPKNPS